MIGQATSTKRIMAREAYYSGRIRFASQDGSREFISLLACIGATGTALPPMLIYKGESMTLRDTWVEDFDANKTPAYFTTSPNGWSCNNIGKRWLLSVFDRHTNKGPRVRRLLIVDGHASHVNMEFITECDRLRIILAILPPHTTHRLQPLDVSLFAPLSTFYTQKLNTIMSNSLGLVSMTKRHFWTAFEPSWNAAFSVANILSGFEKTGIWPLNPSMTLSQIIKAAPTTTADNLKGLQTPMTCKSIRRAQRLFYTTSNSAVLKKLFTANERLASQHSIDDHVIRGLIISLKDEKKKRYRSKRLNLLNEEGSGPQIFSPRRVQQAKANADQKEQEEVQRQQNIINRRAAAANKKAQREAEKLQRTIQATYRREVAAEVRAQKAYEKQAQAELKKAHSTPQKKQLVPKRASIEVTKASERLQKSVATVKSNVAVVKVPVPAYTTSTGRRVCRPPRFGL